MKTLNIHEAESQLSKLLEEVSKGESLLIAKAGKPVPKITALRTPTGAEMRKLSFIAGQISVPEDSDEIGPERD